MRQDWDYKILDEVGNINYGTRVVQKKDKGSSYYVYGGGGATFMVDSYNREDCFIVSRFALSPKCTRYVKGRFFLNDSGLSVSTKTTYLTQSFLDKALLANNDVIYSMGKGLAQRNLDITSFKHLLIPIPPIDEQNTICSLLDNLNLVIEKKKVQIAELDKLVQSLFYDMFGDPINNPQGWEVKQFGEECTELRYGTSRPACENGQYKYLRMGNLTTSGHLDLTDLKTIDIPESEVDKCLVKYGDVLFNRTNSLDLIGKTCMFDLEEPMIIAGYIIRVRLSDRLTPRYVSVAFNMPSMKNLLRKMAKGAVNQANINSKELASIRIPVPPLPLQQSFAEKVEAIERQKELINQSIKDVQTLFDAKMDYYFGD